MQMVDSALASRHQASLSDHGRSQLSHPDVPEPHGIAMILQNDRPFTMLGVAREDGFVSSRPEDFRVVLDEDAVVEDGDRGFISQRRYTR